MLTYVLGNKIDGADADGVTSFIFNLGLHLENISTISFSVINFNGFYSI